MIRIFIGYDHVEAVAYHVLSHSIMTRSSKPVSITPIMLKQLSRIVDRPRDPKQSNDFAFIRFLVPYLCDYEGYAIFMDCDMLCKKDIAELWDLIDPTKAVQVVKHSYIPKNETKYLGNVQTVYGRKNWSSVTIFNNALCRKLTPEYINTASGLELHQFQWLEDEQIGEIPREWNWLVGEYPPNKNANLLHFTVGGPWFDEYKKVDHSYEWFMEKIDTMHTEGK